MTFHTEMTENIIIYRFNIYLLIVNETTNCQSQCQLYYWIKRPTYGIVGPVLPTVSSLSLFHHKTIWKTVKQNRATEDYRNYRVLLMLQGASSEMQNSVREMCQIFNKWDMNTGNAKSQNANSLSIYSEFKSILSSMLKAKTST